MIAHIRKSEVRSNVAAGNLQTIEYDRKRLKTIVFYCIQPFSKAFSLPDKT